LREEEERRAEEEAKKAAEEEEKRRRIEAGEEMSEGKISIVVSKFCGI
jgi:hypothetical protein